MIVFKNYLQSLCLFFKNVCMDNQLSRIDLISQEERDSIVNSIHPAQYDKTWEEIVINGRWKIRILWKEDCNGIKSFHYERDREKVLQHLLKTWKVYSYVWWWEDHMWCWFELIPIDWKSKWDVSKPLTQAIDKVCKATIAAHDVSELSEAATEVCIVELQRILEILWIDWEVEIKKVRKPWISQFTHLLESDRNKFILAVFNDITRTNYPHLRWSNLRYVFSVIIFEYFEKRWIRLLQKDLIKILRSDGISLAPNTFSQLTLNRRKRGIDSEKDKAFIDAYLKGEVDDVLNIVHFDT